RSALLQLVVARTGTATAAATTTATTATTEAAEAATEAAVEVDSEFGVLHFADAVVVIHIERVGLVYQIIDTRARICVDGLPGHFGCAPGGRIEIHGGRDEVKVRAGAKSL